MPQIYKHQHLAHNECVPCVVFSVLLTEVQGTDPGWGAVPRSALHRVCPGLHVLPACLPQLVNHSDGSLCTFPITLAPGAD